MKHLFLIFTFLVSTTFIFASSIIGGELTYEKVGSSSYQVQLKLYRDCTSGSIPFENNVTIKVRKGLGVITGLDFNMPRTSINQTHAAIDSCSFSVCVEEAIYTKIISLPSETQGYHIFYVACCRDAGTNNIINPSNTGEVFNTFIPNTVNYINNSSPSWSNPPEVVLCQNENFSLNHSAIDSDGDSLVYSLYTPYSDTIPTFNNSLPAPNNIQFSTVTWGTGFSTNNPLNNSGTLLSIDPNTGVLSGIAENVGQFVVGIKCEEFRGGVKIGEVLRDFNYQVFDCSSSKEAKIGPLDGCNGNVIDMVNDSPSGASNFHWDFGDGSAPSTDYEPTHSFPGTGNFTVTLISQYGTPCADTATQLVKIGVVFAQFSASTDSICITNTVSFTENSQAYGDMTLDTLLWKFGDGTISTVPNPTHTFINSGNMIVKLIAGADSGCLDSIVKPIYVQGLPIADTGPDTSACFGNPSVPLNGSVTNADDGIWTGNGGAFSPSSNYLNSTYVPSSSEIALGYTQIILHTTGNGFCSSNSDTLNITFIDHPIIDVGPNLSVCADTSFIPLSATTQFTNGVEWNTTNGSGSFINPQAANTIYIPSPIDFSMDSIQFIAETINNGGCTESADTLWIKFTAFPSINYIYSDTICENEVLHLNAYAVTNVTGTWSTGGDGTFNTPLNHITDYFHGPTDLSSQQVEIYFETTNNGICPIQYDTLNIVIVPNPIVDFSYSQECKGTSTVFTSNITSAVPTSTYSWQENSYIFSTHKDTSYVLFYDTATVTFIASTPQGCADTITKTIIPYVSPVAHFNVVNPCSNSNTEFIDSSYIDGGTITGWEWNFDDGSTSTLQNPDHVYSSGGNYNVQLIVTSPDNCIDTLIKPVVISTGPTAEFSTSPSAANVGDAITFTDESAGGATIDYWEWDFDDGDFAYNQNTYHSYNNGGKYYVSLFVQDINDCVDSVNHTIVIRVEPSVPSAFSPNGDGNNDYLKVYGGPYKTLDFRVYNNWGEEIFQMKDNASNGWDGTYKGNVQPVGVYVWTLKATTNSGVEYETSGDVSLIR